MGFSASSGLVAALGVVSALTASSLAHADVKHTVSRGHTVEAIANRYHVTAKAIIEANHLKNVKHLRIGEVLTIPGVKDAPEKRTSKATKAKADEHGDKKPGSRGEKTAKAEKTAGRETTKFAMKAKTPGVIHIHRAATSEKFDIRFRDKRGRISATALKTFEKAMRSPNGTGHPIEPRLVTLLGIVSNHFGSRKIELISGFRPVTPTQFNPHSNHMHGKAVDFRVVGVPNEALRDFCRTLKNVGCGYYPNSVFVHMDSREKSTFWTDYSRPGEAPRYAASSTGTNEVAGDEQARAHGAPTEAPTPDATTAPASSASTTPSPHGTPTTETPSPTPTTPNAPSATTPTPTPTPQTAP